MKEKKDSLEPTEAINVWNNEKNKKKTSVSSIHIHLKSLQKNKEIKDCVKL